MTNTAKPKVTPVVKQSRATLPDSHEKGRERFTKLLRQAVPPAKVQQDD